MSKLIKKNNQELYLIENARASYPFVFEREEYNGKPTKFAITLLIKKSDKKTKAILDSGIANTVEAARKKYGKFVPQAICLKDGDEQLNLDGEIKDGYEGCWCIKASSNTRPNVKNRDGKSPLTKEDGVIYGGCIVNALIDFWPQHNKWGNKINSNLYAVQFVADDEPLGTSRVDTDDVFEDVDVDTDGL